jgi:hypothetical protein
MAKRVIIGLVLVGAVVGLGGCNAVGGLAADQRRPGKVVTLEPGELTGLPTPGGAASSGPPAERGTAVSESFKVIGLAPGDVLAFYADALPPHGWVVSTPPSGTGDVWRGQWARRGRILQVTAEPDIDDGAAALPAPGSRLDLALSPG